MIAAVLQFFVYLPVVF